MFKGEIIFFNVLCIAVWNIFLCHSGMRHSSPLLLGDLLGKYAYIYSKLQFTPLLLQLPPNHTFKTKRRIRSGLNEIIFF